MRYQAKTTKQTSDTPFGSLPQTIWNTNSGRTVLFLLKFSFPAPVVVVAYFNSGEPDIWSMSNQVGDLAGGKFFVTRRLHECIVQCIPPTAVGLSHFSVS